MDVCFRFLEPSEGPILTQAIRTAYGDSYDAEWVYDPEEIGARLADGRYLSCVAESPAGDLLCHAGMSRETRDDAVGHTGQAVTMPAARGRHLFTLTKQHLADAARRIGLAGLFSEATAAHPYSQKANVDLGANETGFLLGWIPATVDNDATERSRSRQSAALFYLKLNDGKPRSAFAPKRQREIIGSTIDLCGLRSSLAEPPPGTELQDRSTLHIERRDDHGLTLIHVEQPGADLAEAISAARRHEFHQGLDAVYVDLPLDRPATALTSDGLADLGLSYCGVFANTRADGDVLRLQSLHRVKVTPDDISVASEHGRMLLSYVLEDLGATHPA